MEKKNIADTIRSEYGSSISKGALNELIRQRTSSINDEIQTNVATMQADMDSYKMMRDE